MHPVSPPEVVTLTLSTLAGRHPVVDATIALIVFLAAISALGSALWLARHHGRG